MSNKIIRVSDTDIRPDQRVVAEIMALINETEYSDQVPTAKRLDTAAVSTTVRSIVSDLMTEIDVKESSLIERHFKIAELENRVSELDRFSRELSESAAAMASEFSATRKSYELALQRINTLEEQVSREVEYRGDSNEDLAKANETIENLKRTIEQLTDQVNKSDALRNEYAEQYRNLREQYAYLFIMLVTTDEGRKFLRAHMKRTNELIKAIKNNSESGLIDVLKSEYVLDERVIRHISSMFTSIDRATLPIQGGRKPRKK